MEAAKFDSNDFAIIKEELARLKKEMNSMRENMNDFILSGEDIEAIRDYEKKKAAGKLMSQKEVEKELGL